MTSVIAYPIEQIALELPLAQHATARPMLSHEYIFAHLRLCPR